MFIKYFRKLCLNYKKSRESREVHLANSLTEPQSKKRANRERAESFNIIQGDSSSSKLRQNLAHATLLLDSSYHRVRGCYHRFKTHLNTKRTLPVRDLCPRLLLFPLKCRLGEQISHHDNHFRQKNFFILIAIGKDFYSI